MTQLMHATGLKDKWNAGRGHLSWTYYADEEGKRQRQEYCNWLAKNHMLILTEILRLLDLPNETLTNLASDGLFAVEKLNQRMPGRHTVKFNFSQELGEKEVFCKDSPSLDLSLFGVTAASAILNELFFKLAYSSNVFGEKPEQPYVVLNKGSIKFTIGGGLFGSGVALLVACGSGMVPVLGGLTGGVSLSTIGLIEIILNWRNSLMDMELKKEQIGSVNLIV